LLPASPPCSNEQCLSLKQALALGTSQSRRLAAAPAKTCLNSCGGATQGTCGFANVNTGAAVTTCPLTDPTCSAVCKCASGYYGPSCALAAADLASQQSLRALLLGGLYNSTKASDTTTDTVAGWTAQISSLTQSYATLTPTAVQAALSVLQTILGGASTLAVPYSTVVAALGACDALLQVRPQ